jgi:hypothetical protein
MPTTRPGLVASVILALAALAGASPAAADTDLGTVGGLNYISENSQPVAAGGGEDAEADCPSGTHVVGGGAEVGGNAADSHLNTIYPFDGADANPAPDDGWASHFWNAAGVTKSVYVVAVCKQGKARYRSSAGNVKPGRARTLKARCPEGTHVSGGGVYTDGSIQSAYVNSSYPYDGPDAGDAPDDGWKGRAYNLDPVAQRMTVHAICGANKPRYETVGPVVIDSSAGVGSQAECPDSRHITAGGIRLGAAPASEAHPVTMLLSDLGDLDTIPDDRLLAVAGVDGSTDAAMSMQAICK